MEVEDDALPLNELDEEFVEDAKEEEIQYNEFLLQEEDYDDDREVVLFEGLVPNLNERFEDILPEEIILPVDEILPVTFSNEES